MGQMVYICKIGKDIVNDNRSHIYIYSFKHYVICAFYMQYVFLIIVVLST